MFDIVELAHQVIDLDNKNRYLRYENERLRGIEEKYNALLDSSIQHSNAMMGHLLNAALAGKLVP